MSRVDRMDLGSDHVAQFVGWHPDRTLNPHLAEFPDVERWGMTITHRTPDGRDCCGFVTFEGEVQQAVEPTRSNRWTVESWEPLTLSPSVLCSCGDHGYVRDGLWMPC